MIQQHHLRPLQLPPRRLVSRQTGRAHRLRSCILGDVRSRHPPLPTESLAKSGGYELGLRHLGLRIALQLSLVDAL